MAFELRTLPGVHRKALTGAVRLRCLCLQSVGGWITLALERLFSGFAGAEMRVCEENALSTGTGSRRTIRTACHAALLHEAAGIGPSFWYSFCFFRRN